MKTTTALLILVTVTIFGHSVIQGLTAKQDFRHCMTIYADTLITDADITDTVRSCELKTGYSLDKELLP